MSTLVMHPVGGKNPRSFPRFLLPIRATVPKIPVPRFSQTRTVSPTPMTEMNDALFWILGILGTGLISFLVGSRIGRRRGESGIEGLLRDVEAGEVPGSTSGAGQAGGAEGKLRRLLSESWVPRGSERDEAVNQAMLRIASYLRHRVESPLLLGLEKGGRELRRSADEALDAVEDLEFFLEDAPVTPQRSEEDLVEIVQGVVREFAAQSNLIVKVEAPEGNIPIRVRPEAFKDAVFLILHNAGEFGEGNPVRVVMDRHQEKARLRIRDQGPGFSAEALLKAQDPFYSTSPGGLGLGLPHAHRAIAQEGGEIFLRNHDGEGAEVEVLLPVG